MKRASLLFCASLVPASAAFGQAPEILHYTFDSGAVENVASPGHGGVENVIDVGFAAGATCGGVGFAAESLSTSVAIETNWTVDLGMSDWTVGMILDLSGGGNGFQYYFGGSSASSFRCFGNGAAGVDNIMLRSPGGDIVIPGATALGAPTHVVFVYDSTIPEIRGYLDGVQVATMPQSQQLNLVGSAPDFNVMRYATSSGMVAGNRMDEFRFYRRALSTGEIVDWASCGGVTVGTNYCMTNPNSTGATSVISGVGTDLVGANDLTLMVENMPASAFGFFLASRMQGFTANAGGSEGNLCVGGAIGRYVGPGQIQLSDASGVMSLQLDLTMTPTPTGLVAVQAGETWFFQAWHRDLVAGVSTSNFSDGLQVDFQ